MRLLIVLLPFFALVIVGGAVGAAMTMREQSAPASDGAAPWSTGTPTADAATPDPTPQSSAPRLAPQQSVCQGFLHRPDPGQPRTFPAVYTQRRDVLGFTVVASENVPVEALDVAVRTIEDMFPSESLRQPLVEAGAYVVIADRDQRPDDLPEFACLVERYGPGFFTHVCGIADQADYPVVSVNAADLLGERGGPCQGLNVLYHELGHLVHGWVISPADYIDVRVLYQEAMDSGAYGREAYAMTNPSEYFAEATQAYFTDNRRPPIDRKWLQKNDPQLYALLLDVYGEP